MIAGVGVDSIEIGRIAAALSRNPRLRQRLYTPAELAESPEGEKAWPRLAALFAAKEAVFKALGTGLAGHSWLEIEVVHNQQGAPTVWLSGRAATTARQLGVKRLHLSLSHDRKRALAFCVAEEGTQCNG